MTPLWLSACEKLCEDDWQKTTLHTPSANGLSISRQKHWLYKMDIHWFLGNKQWKYKKNLENKSKMKT